MQTALDQLLKDVSIDKPLRTIAEKAQAGERITPEEGIRLFESAPIGFLGMLANAIREKRHGDITYFNRNFHIEPTNVCVFACKFCAYSRLYKNREAGWELSEKEILDIVRSYKDKPVTEVHIVGGVHPRMDLHYFADILQKIKAIKPDLHIKAFTAVELEYMIRKAKMNFREGLEYLKEHGLASLPGGGAEIFDEEVRREICRGKANTDAWLDIHETAHQLGMKSNATMLYGHIEKYVHRIDHMERLRALQDRTGGFNTFIPLKFRNADNEMSHVPEAPMTEDIRTYAIGRIYLDNFDHIKAYWPMIGRDNAQMLLAYGVNDIDGTIDDSTKIYSMAGAEEQKPVMTTDEIVRLIQDVGRHPVERDTLYKVVRDYNDYAPETEESKHVRSYA